MDRTVTIRFYDVSRTDEGRPALRDVLEQIARLPLVERERHIDHGEILVRLEDFRGDGDCVAGQFIRAQTGGLPGRMLPDRTDNLPFAEPLGHGIAFRYRPHDGLLAIQYDNRVLSPGKVLTYLYEFAPRAEFVLEPRMRDDALARFRALPLRSLEIAVAGPPDIDDEERADDSVYAGIARMKRRYGADTVRIKMSMGHRGGSLLEDAKEIALEALARFNGQDGQIRAIKGTVDPGEGVRNEEIDLMGELFDVKEDLRVNERDVARFYMLRYELLRQKVREL